MEYLFKCWEKLEKTLSPKILLMDYDGTLTPIVSRPELAVLSSEMKDVIRRISKRYKVGIISGRSLANIKDLVGLEGICYAGNHGFEISGLGLEFVKPEAERARPVISTICKEMAAKLGHIKGVIIENKGLTASVHFRLVADENLQELNEIFHELIKPHLKSDAIRLTRGKKVFEIRPNVYWDKGKAVMWMIDALGIKKESTIYMGDDRTDEDAFSALKEGGMTILVTGRVKRSNAKYFLKNVSEVKTFLEKLINIKITG